MRNKIKYIFIALLLFTLIGLPAVKAQAADLDRITDYTVIAQVNPDATVTLTYHIDWTVLDSDSEGPLEWVKIGIPNKHYVDYEALSDNISEISYMTSGGSYIRLDFDRKYYEGESLSFAFSVVQDYLYQVDMFEEGMTVYEFTPGWFDDIDVDCLTVKWKNDKLSSWSPKCLTEGQYNVWTTELKKGDTFTVQLTYPNDAYGFDLSKNIAEHDETEPGEAIAIVLGVLLGVFVVFFLPIIIIVAIVQYSEKSGFGKEYDTKITRTKVEYWPECQSCGGTREEGQEYCKFCGQSFIKSEEVIKEENVPKEDQEALNYKTEGVFRYSSMPNTYVRVHVVKTPRPVTRPVTTHRSSCAHSSCACACACACAGGGRAGCSSKDFYNTNLKLKYLAKTKRKSK